MEYNNVIPHLCREIDARRNVIKKDPINGLKIANKHTGLIEIANHYSWWLEHDQEREEIIAGGGKSKDDIIHELQKKSRIGRERSEEAWSYLSQHAPLSANLTVRLLKDVGEILEPEENTVQIVGADNNGFRVRDVTMRYRDYTPPSWEKIPKLMEEMISTVKKIKHPVETAIYLHLRTAGTQPFYDGNKRTARLLQNRMLYENMLPPGTVLPAEREHYVGLLEKALVGIRDDIKGLLYPFYTFIGSKVKAHLDDIITSRKS